MKMHLLLKLTDTFINTAGAAKLPQHPGRSFAINACQSRGEHAPSLDKSERPCAFPPDFLVGA
ncbi:hypothetical protein [Rhizobium etli]|uniref:Uncharacterized protein n=1 Tax=Rhizobium etli TaxID=29449 RepID=A0A7W6ZLB9_RHIET|nr:hypothetical protein [Rhizobium etli]MBB4481993.1 hypothetical protein [Rhizobium etli]MBB4537822.1 hypothetical protein [Rhizobium etli]